MKKCLYILSGVCLPLLVFSQTNWEGSWTGFIQYQNSSWPVRLHISHEDEVLLDLPSLILAEEPLEAFLNHDTIRMELPFGLGQHHFFMKEEQLFSRHPSFPIHLKRDAPPPYQKEKLEWYCNKTLLKGELYIPEQEGPHPLMIRLHGANTSSTDIWAYRSWADYFARLGVAVIIFDRRGEGNSGGSWQDASFNQLAEDVLALLKKVPELINIDTSKIILGGGSQAAYVATIAHQMSESIDYLILSSVSATEVIEQEYWALKFRMEKDGRPPEEIQQAIAYQELYFHYVRTGRNWETLSEEIKRLADKPWMKYLDMPRSPEDLNWWRNTYDHFRPGLHLRGISIPTLFIYGEEDTVTPPQIMVPLLKGLLESGSLTDYEIYQLPGAGHDLEMRPGMDRWGRFLWPRKHPEMLQIIEEWLLKHHILRH